MTTYEKKLDGHKITQEYKDFAAISSTEDHRIDVLTTLMDKVEVEEGYRLYRGFKPEFQESNWSKVIRELLEFKRVWEWTTAYREVFIKKDLKSKLTYIEGDLILKVFDNKKDFEKDLKEAGEFYAKGY